MIKAVLFDLDDTLFDHEHCARAALDAVCASHPGLAAIARESIELAHARILEELHVEVLSGRMALEASRIERFRRLFAATGVERDDQLVERTASTYRQHYVRARRPIDRAAALLSAVRRRARVGIVSNNLLQEQQDKLRCCELDAYIDVLIVSEEAGVSKPDPRIFEMALERLKCSPEDAVMVGDSWSADVAGASAAGIRAIWFKRGGRDSDSAAYADLDGTRIAIIDSLEPTPELLRTIFDAANEHRE